MFGIGPMELIIIALVAVVLIGPQKLPEVMKQFGRFFVQARRYSNDVRTQVQSVIDEAENELRLEELEKLRAQLKAANPQVLLEQAIGPLDAQGHPLPQASPQLFANPHQPEHSTASVLSSIETGHVPHFDDPYLRGDVVPEPLAEVAAAVAPEAEAMKPKEPQA